jgi:hypothetical protein
MVGIFAGLNLFVNRPLCITLSGVVSIIVFLEILSDRIIV